MIHNPLEIKCTLKTGFHFWPVLSKIHALPKCNNLTIPLLNCCHKCVDSLDLHMFALFVSKVTDIVSLGLKIQRSPLLVHDVFHTLTISVYVVAKVGNSVKQIQAQRG